MTDRSGRREGRLGAPIKWIPVYFQVKWGRGWTVDGTIDCYRRVGGFKKLDLQPLPPMQERPFHEFHDEMFRWYDHWLKGIDTGICAKSRRSGCSSRDRGSGAPRKNGRSPGRCGPNTTCARFTASTPRRSRWRRARVARRLLSGPVDRDARRAVAEVDDGAAAGGHRNDRPGALYVHVAIDTDDTNLIAKLYDVDPQGNRQVVSSGYLKASHRELDAAKSKPWRPHHPHTRSVPVPPGEVIEYAIRIDSFSNLFKAGHRIQFEFVCNEPFADAFSQLLPPDSYHLPSGRATTHKISRDARASVASAAAGHSGGAERRLAGDVALCTGKASRLASPRLLWTCRHPR